MIAVYVNEDGKAASLNEKGAVRIYSREQNGWKVEEIVYFHVEIEAGIAQARKAMVEMVQKLKNCKIFVAKELVGQLYYVLEANGFEGFEAEGQPEEFLDSVWEAVKSGRENKAESQPRKEPADYIEKTDREGVYFINLQKALNLDCSLTSKKLLIPFLQKKEFLQLEVLCDHIPRWFATELPRMDLDAMATKFNEKEYKIIITAN